MVYGAFDANGNYVDGEIVIKNALISVIPLFGSDPVSYSPRLNLEDNFILYNNSNEGFGLSNEIQLYDMARVGSHEFIQSRDIVYNNYKSLIVNGNDSIGENNGSDDITINGGIVNAKGGVNNISSLGDDRINVTGIDNIYFQSDDEINTNKTVNISSTGQANIENVMGVGSTLIKYDNSVKNVMFSFYGGTENTSNSGECGYLTLHAFDADGNIVNLGDKIYGHMNGTILDFDDKDEGGNILIDNKLTVLYNKDVERGISDMVQYVDMAVINDEFDVYNYGGMQYIGKGYYVQGTESNDKYWWEFAGNVTINEQGGNDTLTIHADDGMLRGARNTKFIFDVSVTRNEETNEITGVTMGDDIIFVSDFNSGGQLENYFSTNANTRNSVATLTVKDYFKSEGANMDNIELSYSIGSDNYVDIFNYNYFINNNQILESVTAWLTENSEYSSVMDAINNCSDQTKLNSLMNCYGSTNFDYWTQQEV